MIVREESQTLYGFLDAPTRDMFATLQTVSGLGPKLALAAQSVYTTPELAHAITHGDTKTLQKIPGVGKRMAERMVVDLKDKVATYATPETPAPVAVPHTDTYEQVLEALASLGFAEKTAEPVLTTVLAADPTLTTPAALRASLNKSIEKRISFVLKILTKYFLKGRTGLPGGGAVHPRPAAEIGRAHV